MPPGKPLSALTPGEAGGRAVFVSACARCHNAYDTQALHGPSLYGVFRKPYLPSGAPARDDRVIGSDPARTRPDARGGRQSYGTGTAGSAAVSAHIMNKPSNAKSPAAEYRGLLPAMAGIALYMFALAGVVGFGAATGRFPRLFLVPASCLCRRGCGADPALSLGMGADERGQLSADELWSLGVYPHAHGRRADHVVSEPGVLSVPGTTRGARRGFADAAARRRFATIDTGILRGRSSGIPVHLDSFCAHHGSGADRYGAARRQSRPG